MCCLFYVFPLLLYYWHDTFVLLCIKIPIFATYYYLTVVYSLNRDYYIVGTVWFSISVIINCGTGCLNVLVDCKTEKKVKSCAMGCGIGIIPLSIELIIHVIMLIANVIIGVYRHRSADEAVNVILLGVIGLLVLLLLIIHIIVFTTLCLYINCRRKVARATSRLYRKRERQQVEICNVPQTEPVPPYDTIEMLPVNESQVEPVPPFEPTEEIVYLNQPAAEPEPIYDPTGVNTPIDELQMEPEPTYTSTIEPVLYNEPAAEPEPI